MPPVIRDPDELGKILDVVLAAQREVLRMFSFERYIHMVVVIISFSLSIYAGYLMIEKNLDVWSKATLFSSTGFFAFSAARVVWQVNRVVLLVEVIIRKVIK